MKELKKKLTQLEIEFSKNLNEEKSSYEFSEEELSKIRCYVVNVQCKNILFLIRWST